MEEEVATAAITGDSTSLSVSLELDSAVAGMSGLGPEGSSSILAPILPPVPSAPTGPAKAALIPSVAAGSRSRQRHFSAFQISRERGRGLLAGACAGAGPDTRGVL